MRKERVHTEGQALAYMIECTMATVESLALQKRPPVGELRRQCSIAQTGIDWALQMGVDLTASRAEKADFSVAQHVMRIREDNGKPALQV